MDWRGMQMQQQGNEPLNVARNAYWQKQQYDIAKAELEIYKNQTMLNQRLGFEAQKADIKEQSMLRREMISYEVYKDSMGRMVYVQVGANEEKLRSKILFKEINFDAKYFVTFHPRYNLVLAVSWEGCNGNLIFFQNTMGEISPQKFLKCLKSCGIILQISKRREMAIAEALLSYSLNTEKVVEIPFYNGWNMMKNGEWHFAKNDEMVMEVVLENVR